MQMLLLWKINPYSSSKSSVLIWLPRKRELKSATPMLVTVCLNEEIALWNLLFSHWR